MKKNYQDTLFNSDINPDKNIELNVKTTNVNILLNRVRLDKKSFKKRIIFSTILIFLVSSLAIFLLLSLNYLVLLLFNYERHLYKLGRLS